MQRRMAPGMGAGLVAGGDGGGETGPRAANWFAWNQPEARLLFLELWLLGGR